MAKVNLSEFLHHLTRATTAQMMVGESDSQLVEKILARRDEAAFEAVVHRHGPMVYRVCYWVLQHSQDAEDAFQATFLLLAHKLPMLRHHASLASWLHGVARRVALKAKAKTAAQRRHEQQSSRPEALPPKDLMGREEPSALDFELSRLPDKWRLPLILCYLEGRTQDESASQLGWSKSTLRRRLQEARNALGNRLKERGIVWPAALSAILVSDCTASAGLLASTVKAAAGIAGGKKVATAASTRVVALTEGVLKAMLITKLKTATAVLLVIALIGGGVWAGVNVLTPRGVTTNRMEAKPDKPKTPTSSSRSLKGPHKFFSLSWSRDGKTLAAITKDAAATEPGDVQAKNAVRLWDVRSGSVKRTLAEDRIEDRNYITYAGVGLAADGKTVAAPAGGKFDGEFGFWVVLWDAETGKIRHKLKHSLEVRALAFSPDGKTMATGTGGNLDRDFEIIKLWNVQTGQVLRALETTNKCAVRVAFGPDGKQLAAVLHQGQASAEVILWDTADGKASRTLADSDGIEAIAFSPDGKTLLGAARTKLRVWDVVTGKTVQASDLKTGYPDEGWSAIAFSPDGKTLAISPGLSAGKQDHIHVIALYDVTAAKRTKTLEGHKGFIHALSFAPDSKTLASGGYEDQTIYLWDLDRVSEVKK